VVLTSQPTGDVTVDLTGNDASEASLSTSTLTFTAANWNIPQSVTVTGVDDAVKDGDISFVLTIDPSGADYGTVASQTVAITNSDNDATGNEAAVRLAFGDQTYNFMSHRAGLIASHEPTLFRLINRESGETGSMRNGFNVAGDSEGIKGDFAFSANTVRKKMSDPAHSTITPTADIGVPRETFDAWVEGQFAAYDQKNSTLSENGSFIVGYAGIDMRIYENLIVGLMSQVDWTEEKSTGGKVRGTGWMFGPYLTAEPADNVFFDLRAMWGRSNNSAAQTVLGANYAGDFDTQRWLVEATLSGKYELSPFTIKPDAKFTYLQEKQKDYEVTDGFTSIAIDGQDMSLGQISTGFTLSQRMQSDTATFEPYVGGRVYWTFANPGLYAADGASKAVDDLRAAATFGFNLTSDTTMFSLEGSYDGLFSNDVDVLTGKLMFTHKF
jgi:hypothetical protein